MEPHKLSKTELYQEYLKKKNIIQEMKVDLQDFLNDKNDKIRRSQDQVNFYKERLECKDKNHNLLIAYTTFTLCWFVIYFFYLVLL